MFVSAVPAGGLHHFRKGGGSGAGARPAAFVDIRETDAHVEAINWKKCANRVALNAGRDPFRGTRWHLLT